MPRLAERARAQRSQGGSSLIETMVAIAISAIVVGPVGAWMVLTFTTQAPTAAGFTDAGQSRILNTYVTRDVSSSEIAVVNPSTDLVGCSNISGLTADPILNLYDLGNTKVVVVYGVVDSPSGATKSLYRWQCQLTAERKAIDAVEILRNMRSISAVCADDADQCSKVTVEATSEESGHETSVTATRRSSAASLDGFGGNATPVPYVFKGSRTDRTKTDPFTMDLVGGAWDPDTEAAALGYSWSVAGAAVVTPSGGQSTTFSAWDVGEYEVIFTVNDGPNTRTLSRFVEVTNAPPEITSSECLPDPAETRRYACSASAEDIDTDDTPTFEWRYPTDSAGGEAVQTGSSFPLDLDPSLTGVVVIEVQATDGDRGTTSDYLELDVGTPVDAEIITDPALVTRPGLLPLLVSTGDADPVSRTAAFSTTAIDVSGWRLLDEAGEEIGISSGAELTHTFPQGSSGRYSVELQRSTGGPESLDFRVNAPPRADFVHTDPSSASGTVTFTSTSTDDFGLRPLVSWDFNSVGPFSGDWTASTPEAAITYNSPGRYVVELQVTDVDGLNSQTTKVISVPGLPPQPNPPTWDPARPNHVVFEAVAGASGYTVVLSHGGLDGEGDPCSKSVEINVGVMGPFEALDTGNPCAPPRQTEAALRVIVNGQPSTLSNWTSK